MSEKKTLTDLVFENRNKEYGAYVLRKMEPVNLRRALIIGVILFTALGLGIYIYNVELKKRKEREEKVVDVTMLDIKEDEEILEIIEDEPEPEPEPPQADRIQEETAQVDYRDPVPKEDVVEEKPMASIDDAENKDLGAEDREGEASKNIAGGGPVSDKGSNEGQQKKENTGDTGSGKVYTAREVSEMAIYPGCEKHKGNSQQLQKCLSEKLSGELGIYLEDFKDIAEREGISEAVSRMKFVIDRTGKINRIEALTGGNKSLDKESKKALEQIADRLQKRGRLITPAKLNDGTAVNLTFSLPVKFQIAN